MRKKKRRKTNEQNEYEGKQKGKEGEEKRKGKEKGIKGARRGTAGGPSKQISCVSKDDTCRKGITLRE